MECRQRESCDLKSWLAQLASVYLSLSPLQCWTDGAVSCTTTTVNVCISHHWIHLEDSSIPLHAWFFFFSDEKEGSKTLLKGN